MIDIVDTPEYDLKNIRQIGTPAEGDRIYIENAAYARIHEEDYEQRRVFIFMGHTECSDGIYTTFVEAAIPVRDIEFAQNLPHFGVHAWSDIFREIKRSYENSIIVGWALDCKGFPPRLTAELEAIHREQFGGAHQVLLLMDSVEGEEYFYLCKGNRLQQRGGFYVFYAHRLREVCTPDVTVEFPGHGSLQALPDPEQTLKSRCDESLQKKQDAQNEKKASSYALAAAAALLVLLVGAGVWQGRIPLDALSGTVQTISRKISGGAQPAEVLVGTELADTQKTAGTEEGAETVTEPMTLIPIEEIPAGEVKKLDETTQEETETETETQTAQTKETRYYTVKKGDTLTGICKELYGSTACLKELEQANGLENSDDIRVGQKLLLP